jgi:hypothetical protein
MSIIFVVTIAIELGLLVLASTRSIARQSKNHHWDR